MSTLYVSKAAYAIHRGISPAAVTKHIKNGVIALNDNGEVDLAFSDQLLDAYTKSRLNPNKTRKYKKEDSKPVTLCFGSQNGNQYDALEDSYLKARADLTRHKADLALLEYEEANGLLSRNDTIERESFNCARKTRDSVMSVPDRIGAVLASETSVLEVKRILKEELTKALESVIEILENEGEQDELCES